MSDHTLVYISSDFWGGTPAPTLLTESFYNNYKRIFRKGLHGRHSSTRKYTYWSNAWSILKQSWLTDSRWFGVQSQNNILPSNRSSGNTPGGYQLLGAPSLLVCSKVRLVFRETFPWRPQKTSLSDLHVDQSHRTGHTTQLTRTMKKRFIELKNKSHYIQVHVPPLLVHLNETIQ